MLIGVIATVFLFNRPCVCPSLCLSHANTVIKSFHRIEDWSWFSWHSTSLQNSDINLNRGKVSVYMK